MTKLPEFLRPYFWDVDFDGLNGEVRKVFVAQRIIDRGDTKAVRWLLKTYPTGVIGSALRLSRDLSRKTAGFWSDLLMINPSEVPCLQKPYSRVPFGVSN